MFNSRSNIKWREGWGFGGKYGKTWSIGVLCFCHPWLIFFYNFSQSWGLNVKGGGDSHHDFGNFEGPIIKNHARKPCFYLTPTYLLRVTVELQMALARLSTYSFVSFLILLYSFFFSIFFSALNFSPQPSFLIHTISEVMIYCENFQPLISLTQILLRFLFSI